MTFIQNGVASSEISPYVGIGNDSFTFSIESLTPSLETPIDYEPNISGLVRVGINAYGYGLSGSFRGDAQPLDPVLGHSEFYDYQLNYHQKKYGVDLFVQNYKGFYIRNSDALGGTMTAPLVFSDLKFSHYGFMSRYALSDSRFSISALLNQAEPIRSTDGCIYFVAGFHHYSLNSDQNILPQSTQGLNLKMDDLRELKSNSLNLGIGAGKYWVSQSQFFIGGVLDLIGTFGLYQYKLITTNEKADYGTLSYSGKLGFGYAGDQWKSGFSVTSDVTTLQALNRTYIKPNATSFMVYLRFVMQ